MAPAPAPAQASPSLIWTLIPSSLLASGFSLPVRATHGPSADPALPHSPHVAPQQPWEKSQVMQPNSQGPACSGPHLPLQCPISLYPPQTRCLPSPRRSPTTMPPSCAFFLAQLPSLSSPECSSSPCKMSNIASLVLLCLVSSLSPQPPPWLKPIISQILPPASNAHDATPRDDPVFPTLTALPWTPSIRRQSPSPSN